MNEYLCRGTASDMPHLFQCLQTRKATAVRSWGPYAGECQLSKFATMPKEQLDTHQALAVAHGSRRILTLDCTCLFIHSFVAPIAPSRINVMTANTMMRKLSSGDFPVARCSIASAAVMNAISTNCRAKADVNTSGVLQHP